MKNILFITLISMMFTSCEFETETTTIVSPEKISNSKATVIKDLASNIIGYEFSDKGEKLNLVAGDLSITKIWLDYTQAHNDKNLDKIAELDAVDITVYRADGTIGKGSDNHQKFLSDWFKSSNPNWKVKWMVANTVAQNDGKFQYWLTTGNEFTDTVEGEKIMVHTIADVNIIEGKIKKINIYSRAKEQE
ncbi:MAG: Uncharacterised protein [Polaribacter sp. SA4-10]|nr:MAG: Uncharacterised protein [Polaribacter sp. SA4-10]|tara:strand:+ start:30 stop:602 length:573 start_codon:yes stop_codon:yes gene_type:complete